LLKEPQIEQPNEFEKAVLDLFKRLSVCMMILGRRDTGKTDISFLIMETLAKFGVINNFATNVKIYASPFPIDHITNLEDLRFWCENKRGRKLFILDEAGKSLRRRTPMSRLNINLLDQLQILRKYKLSMILIVPHTKYIDSATLGSDVLDAEIIKPNFKNRKLALWLDIMENTKITFTGLPATSVDFDTWDVAPFKKEAPTRKPKFKDQDMNALWDLTHGKAAKEVGLHSQQIARLWRKYIKESLEREPHTSRN